MNELSIAFENLRKSSGAGKVASEAFSGLYREAVLISPHSTEVIQRISIDLGLILDGHITLEELDAAVEVGAWFVSDPLPEE